MNLDKFKHKTFCDGRIIMINADCEAVMAEIGDKEIDLVLTDPPYGIGMDGYFLFYYSLPATLLTMQVRTNQGIDVFITTTLTARIIVIDLT